MFTTDMKDLCPIISYSIVKVIEKNSGDLIVLNNSSNPFKVDSLGNFTVFGYN